MSLINKISLAFFTMTIGGQALAGVNCRTQLENYGEAKIKPLTQFCSELSIKKALQEGRFAFKNGKLVVIGKHFLILKPVKDFSEAIKFYNRPEVFLERKLKQKMKLEAISDAKVIAGKIAVPWSAESSVAIHRLGTKDFAFVMDPKANMLYSVDLSKFGSIYPASKTEIDSQVKGGKVFVLNHQALVVVGAKSPRHQVVNIKFSANIPNLIPLPTQEWRVSFRQNGPLACENSNCVALSFSNNSLVRLEVDEAGKVKLGHETDLPGMRNPVAMEIERGTLSIYEGDGKLARVSGE